MFSYYFLIGFNEYIMRNPDSTVPNSEAVPWLWVYGGAVGVEHLGPDILEISGKILDNFGKFWEI